jgi:hypothetical protein
MSDTTSNRWVGPRHSDMTRARYSRAVDHCVGVAGFRERLSGSKRVIPSAAKETLIHCERWEVLWHWYFRNHWKYLFEVAIGLNRDCRLTAFLILGRHLRAITFDVHFNLHGVFYVLKCYEQVSTDVRPSVGYINWLQENNWQLFCHTLSPRVVTSAGCADFVS